MKIIGQIYEALDDDDALAALPSRIAKEIGSRSCTLQLMSSEFQLEGSWVTHFDGEMYDFYLEHNIHRFDAWTNTNLNVFGTNRTERHTDFLPLEKFKNSFYYNEFIRRFGDDSALCLGFISVRPDGGYLVAGLQKGLTDKDFTDEQVAQYDLLRPHLTKMMVLRRNLMLRERMATGALLGIDSIEDAYLVVQPDRKIAFANKSAEKLLQNARLIHSKAGRLHLSQHFADQQLSASLQDALNFKPDGRQSFVASDQEGYSWRITITPRHVDGATCLLIWIDRGKASATAGQVLASMYQLSNAEVPVLMAVSEGLAAIDIADRLQISPATVRSHIQHIYQKTGVKKASQLTALVVSLPRLASQRPEA